MVNEVAPDPYLPCGNMYHCMLNDLNSIGFTKIYCSCGRFVDIDHNAYALKQKLHKVIECSRCRNQRISREFDLLEENADLDNEYIIV